MVMKTLDEEMGMDADRHFEDEVKRVWGWEMLVDLEGCERIGREHEENVRRLLTTLPPAIGMQCVGAPMLHFYGKGAEREGWTVFQMIDTSSITGHFMPATGKGCLNVFSCEEFEPSVVELVVRQYLSPSMLDWALVPRG